MTVLPIHPFTGLKAIGLRRDGRPIYPVRGGSQPTPIPTPPPGDPAPAPTSPPVPTPPPTPTPPTDPADDKPLGPAGERALAAERDARKALERQLAELAPLKDFAAALAGGKPTPGGKTEVELLNDKFATYESDLQAERQARWRAEVAAEKGLTADQAGWIAGATREEFSANADKLIASFPAAPAGPRTPAPDPSQGARGGQPGPDIDAQIAEAQKAGDVNRVINLQRSKLANVKR